MRVFVNHVKDDGEWCEWSGTEAGERAQRCPRGCTYSWVGER